LKRDNQVNFFLLKFISIGALTLRFFNIQSTALRLSAQSADENMFVKTPCLGRNALI